MPSDATIAVRGLTDLERAFKAAVPETQRELRTALRAVAEPVKNDAEQLARANIRRLGGPWSQMRVGVTQKSVYIAEKQRGVKSRTDRRRRRPNLADLLMGRAMEPALERNEALVGAAIQGVLDTVGEAWEAI